MSGLFAYDFVRDAYAAGIVVAVLAAVAGRFVVMRNMSFAVHGIAELGFTGTAAGLLLGVPPLAGLLGGSLVAAAGIGLLGGRLRDRDVAIGSVLAFGLGLGVLFLTLFSRYATEAFAILFGTVTAVSATDVATLAVLAAVTLGVLAAIARPLTFASVDPEVAEARGVPVRALSVVFLLVLGVAVAETVQVVGVLLVLTLAITPAACARHLSAHPGWSTAIGIGIGAGSTVIGITLSVLTAYPASFFVATLSFAAYLVSRGLGRFTVDRRRAGGAPARP